ncbi:MAG: putative DNA binding domain-containing protein [Balneolaceae bacterium]|nr:putative DNA binding domain-containing protein [Balneolaceae bacterium]
MTLFSKQTDISTIADLHLIKESHELECKKALGKDGLGSVPKSMWETYSAFANTDGGFLLLGVKEMDDSFEPFGIPKAEILVSQIYDTLNNKQKVSFNTVGNKDIKLIPGPNGDIIVIYVPPATRKQKPVYLNNNPIGNTYKRLHEGDRLCDDETVKRMLAEQQYDDRDSKIFPGYNLKDIEDETLIRFRQMLRLRNSNHPFLELNHIDFLRKIGGYKRDRETGKEGLTLAGILMFGKWEVIQDAVPYYFVDYQERPEAKTELRWVDRVVPDGTWSGNIFDFYQIVYRKMTTDLKVPFQLKKGQRVEDTPVHEAIREALINALVHADYMGRVSILVVKRPDMFGFRNPGLMRIPVETAYGGGISDCRNRIMHQMFLLAGLGERAGSGIPKIIQNWDKQHWRKPYLHEIQEPEQTLMELRMQSLIPDETMDELRDLFGKEIDKINMLERIILATAESEGVISHQRIQSISETHPHDISLSLQNLVKSNFLVPTGKTKGRTYTLPGRDLPTPEDVFSKGGVSAKNTESDFGKSSEHNPASSEHIGESSEHKADSSKHNSEKERDTKGRLITAEFDFPVIDQLYELSDDYLNELKEKAKVPRNKKRVAVETLSSVILDLCREQYITINALSQIVDRNSDGLRQRYIKKLVEKDEMKMAFPSTPNHEKQAYITSE